VPHAVLESFMRRTCAEFLSCYVSLACGRKNSTVAVANFSDTINDLSKPGITPQCSQPEGGQPINWTHCTRCGGGAVREAHSIGEDEGLMLSSTVGASTTVMKWPLLLSMIGPAGLDGPEFSLNSGNCAVVCASEMSVCLNTPSLFK
jgi:hypothetical protein